MAKSVALTTGKSFKTVTLAQQYFARILESRELKTAFEGDDLADVRAAYVGYCSATNWTLTSPPASFYPTRERGPGYTTRCFGVTFEDGSSGTFSMEKALRSIAMLKAA